jgi:hypothetical protein
VLCSIHRMFPGGQKVETRHRAELRKGEPAADRILLPHGMAMVGRLLGRCCFPDSAL